MFKNLDGSSIPPSRCSSECSLILDALRLRLRVTSPLLVSSSTCVVRPCSGCVTPLPSLICHPSSLYRAGVDRADAGRSPCRRVRFDDIILPCVLYHDMYWLCSDNISYVTAVVFFWFFVRRQNLRQNNLTHQLDLLRGYLILQTCKTAKEG